MSIKASPVVVKKPLLDPDNADLILIEGEIQLERSPGGSSNGFPGSGDSAIDTVFGEEVQLEACKAKSSEVEETEEQRDAALDDMVESQEP